MVECADKMGSSNSKVVKYAQGLKILQWGLEGLYSLHPTLEGKRAQKLESRNN